MAFQHIAQQASAFLLLRTHSALGDAQPEPRLPGRGAALEMLVSLRAAPKPHRKALLRRHEGDMGVVYEVRPLAPSTPSMSSTFVVQSHSTPCSESLLPFAAVCVCHCAAAVIAASARAISSRK